MPSPDGPTTRPSAPGSTFPPPLPAGQVEAARARLLERAAQGAAAGPYAPEWRSLQAYRVPEWLLDAKFGIFVHWLASSVPAWGSEWYPRTMYLEGAPEHAHHREVWGRQDVFGYKDFLPLFTGERFDARQWVQLAQRAGARYLVPVAEHHDGYSLGATELSRWSATRIGPMRDVIGELRAAAREAGLRFGVSSHRAENWWFFNGGRRFPSDVQDEHWRDLYGPAQPKSTQPDAAHLDDWLARTVELVERHDPDLVWFDWWIEEPAFEPYLRRFAAYYYNTAAARGADAVINYKWNAFAEGSAVYDIERGAARGIQQRFFQNDTSTSRKGWAYLEDDDYKTVEEVLVDLVDAVSKNGSLLLNVGPRPDGTLHPDEVALLEGIGDWLSHNGEAVYGTRPWHVFGEGPTMPAAGSFVDTAPPAWTAEDIRFTRRGDTLYATLLRWPDDRAVRVRTLGTALRVFDGDVRDVRLLGSSVPLRWERDTGGLVVEGMPTKAGPGLPVLRLELEPARPPLRQEPPILE